MEGYANFNILTKGLLQMTSNAPRILMVEDDEDQAMLFTLMLSTYDFAVVATADAESALAHLAETPVDLVLADWNLPGIKGDALIVTVRAQYPAIKTILFSNHIHVETAAVACGADSWFRKMDDTARLRQLMNDLLAKPSTV